MLAEINIANAAWNSIIRLVTAVSTLKPSQVNSYFTLTSVTAVIPLNVQKQHVGSLAGQSHNQVDCNSNTQLFVPSKVCFLNWTKHQSQQRQEKRDNLTRKRNWTRRHCQTALNASTRVSVSYTIASVLNKHICYHDNMINCCCKLCRLPRSDIKSSWGLARTGSISCPL